jgi:hypothetical protein
MTEKIYDKVREDWLKAGYWIRRVAPGKKSCRDQNWQRQQAEIEQTAPYDGIALMAGSPMPDGTTLGFIDVDNEALTSTFRILLNPKCERRGSKGTAIPIRVDGNVGNGKFYIKGAPKPAVELMAHQSIVVIPPTIHPDTRKPYEWLGDSLLMTNPADLPLVDSKSLELIKALIENEHLLTILEGQGTHSAGVALCGRLVHHCDDDKLLKRIVSSLFPPGYEGDSLKELDGWISGARKKIESGKWEKLDTGFIRTKSGVVVVCEKNTRLGVEKLGVSIRYDEFADRELIVVGDKSEVPVTDNIECTLRSQLDLEFNYRVAPTTFRESMRAMALERRFHPVKDYLRGLKWDKVSRIDSWLIECGEAEDTEYVREVSKLILIGACRRIMQPGAKFDEMPVIKSPKQGTYKSTALRLLAVKDDWFCDNFSLDQDSKTLIELTMGKWIVEISELKGLSRGASDHVKALLSRRFDRSRLAYGRITEERPRQFVFIGTTNETEFLRDETGNRRFWPVEIVKVDVQKLRAMRDQLWAEAFQLEQSGYVVKMDDALWEVANEIQERHRVRDNPFVDILKERLGEKEDGKITSVELMELLDIEPGKINNAQFKTLRSAMSELGWEYKKSMKIDGTVKAGYMKGRGAEVVCLPGRGSEKPKDKVAKRPEY